MKTSKFAMFAALAVAAVSPMFAGANPHPKTLADRVGHELRMVPYIDVFDNLAYQVDNASGVVTLSGQVTRPVEKSNAEFAAKHVEGVTRVDNQIEVLPLSPFDDQIRLATFRTLTRTNPVNRYFLGAQPSIRIIVKNGNVTLDGTVLNAFDRQVAFMAANRVSGVFSVTNNLTTEK